MSTNFDNTLDTLLEESDADNANDSDWFHGEGQRLIFVCKKFELRTGDEWRLEMRIER